MSGLDEKGLEVACEAAARSIAKQDGVELSAAGYRQGANARPKEHLLMLEYMGAAIRAYLAASAPPAPDGLVGRLNYAIKEAEFGHESPTHVRALVTHLKQAAATLSAQEAEIERLRAQAERIRELEEALTKRVDWHRCSCPEPCDDYGVFPGGCIGKYREDYHKLRALLRAKEETR